MKPYYETDAGQIYCGGALEVLKNINPRFAQCCITSPPYWALRDYGSPPMVWDGDKDCNHEWGDMCPDHHKGQVPDGFAVHSENATGQTSGSGQFCQKCGAWKGALGLEPTPELYVEHLVQIFREVKRVLKDDGTVWINLGDSYWGGKGQSGQAWSTNHTDRDTLQKPYHQISDMNETRPSDGKHPVLKPKDLVGIPWRVAFALQADGWYLRQDIVWNKKNPMPESVKDRCTKSHEYIFLLTKKAKYYYNADAIKEDAANTSGGSCFGKQLHSVKGTMAQQRQYDRPEYLTRNKRSVWTVNTKSYKEAHFATFPEALIEPCVLAGTAKDDIIIDPFAGALTTGIVAYKHNRKFIGIELNPEYCEIAKQRIEQERSQLKLFQ